MALRSIEAGSKEDGPGEDKNVAAGPNQKPAALTLRPEREETGPRPPGSNQG
jgi:hypothetical protein